MSEKKSFPKNPSRRKVLIKVKNSAKFIVPTILSFKVSKANAVNPSEVSSPPPPPPPDWD